MNQVLTITLLILVLNVIKLPGCQASSSFLLYSQRDVSSWFDGHIYKTSLNKNGLPVQHSNTLITTTSSIPKAIAYDSLTQRIFFEDLSTYYSNKIYSAQLDGTKRQIVVSNVGDVESLEVDVKARNLYWADDDYNRIEVVRLDGTFRKILFRVNGIRNMVLDLKARELYWTRYNYWYNMKIEKASMDGTQRKVILSATHRNKPSGLCIDPDKRILYWAERNMEELYYIHLNNPSKINKIAVTYYRPYKLTFIGERIYWSDRGSYYPRHGEIVSVNVTSKSDVKMVLTSLNYPMGIYGYDTGRPLYGRYPMGIYGYDTGRPLYGNSQCGVNNGGCDHLCLQSPSQDTCVCTNGMTLSDNGKSCYHDEFLLVADDNRKKIFHKSLSDLSHRKRALPLGRTGFINTIDYDPLEGKIYWTNNIGQISRAYLNGSSIERVLGSSSNFDPFGHCIDAIGRNLYWYDQNNKRIGVSKLNGQYPKKDLVVLSSAPVSMALDNKRGYIYWAHSSIKPALIIKRSQMNGTSLETVASWNTKHNFQNLFDVALAFDSDANRMYFHDGNQILYTDTKKMDGLVYTLSLPNWISPKGLAVKEGYLYWGDWFDTAVHRVNKTSLKNSKKVVSGVDAMDLHVYFNNSDTPDDFHPCAQNNGWCTHLCLINVDGYSCACPTNNAAGNCSTKPVVPTVIVPTTKATTAPATTTKIPLKTTTTIPATTATTTTTKLPTTAKPTTQQPTTTQQRPTTQQPTTTQRPTTTQQLTTTKQPATTQRPTTQQPTTTQRPTTTKQPATTQRPTTQQPTTTQRPTTIKQPATTQRPTTTKQPTTTQRPPTTQSTTATTTTTKLPPSTTKSTTTTKPTTKVTTKPTTTKPPTTKPTKQTTTKPTTTPKPPLPATTKQTTTAKTDSTNPATTQPSPPTAKITTTTKTKPTIKTTKRPLLPTTKATGKPSITCPPDYYGQDCTVYIGENKLALTLNMNSKQLTVENFKESLAEGITEYCRSGSCAELLRSSTKVKRDTEKSVKFSVLDIIVLSNPTFFTIETEQLRIEIAILNPLQKNKAISKPILCKLVFNSMDNIERFLKGPTIVKLSPECGAFDRPGGNTPASGKQEGGGGGGTSSSVVITLSVLFVLLFILIVIFLVVRFVRKKGLGRRPRHRQINEFSFHNIGYLQNDSVYDSVDPAFVTSRSNNSKKLPDNDDQIKARSSSKNSAWSDDDDFLKDLTIVDLPLSDSHPSDETESHDYERLEIVPPNDLHVAARPFGYARLNPQTMLNHDYEAIFPRGDINNQSNDHLYDHLESTSADNHRHNAYDNHEIDGAAHSELDSHNYDNLRRPRATRDNPNNHHNNHLYDHLGNTPRTNQKHNAYENQDITNTTQHGEQPGDYDHLKRSRRPFYENSDNTRNKDNPSKAGIPKRSRHHVYSNDEVNSDHRHVNATPTGSKHMVNSRRDHLGEGAKPKKTHTKTTRHATEARESVTATPRSPTALYGPSVSSTSSRDLESRDKSTSKDENGYDHLQRFNRQPADNSVGDYDQLQRDNTITAPAARTKNNTPSNDQPVLHIGGVADKEETVI